MPPEKVSGSAPGWEPLQKLDKVERPDRLVVPRPKRRGMAVYYGNTFPSAIRIPKSEITLSFSDRLPFVHYQPGKIPFIDQRINDGIALDLELWRNRRSFPYQG
jgi:hypothetical protein